MSKRPVKFDLNPLFGGPSLADRQKSGSPYREIAISEIDVDPYQPRRIFSEESLSELASSIKEHGILSPLLVRLLEGGTYRLVAGERRLRASKLAGLERVPVMVDTAPDDRDTVLAKQLVENLQREDLSSMERALAIGQLRDSYNLSIRDIAAKLGISKGAVQRSLEVLGLAEDLQAALINGAAESKVLLLAKVEDKRLRAKLLSQLSELTREQLEAEIEMAMGGNSKVSHRGTAKGGEMKSTKGKLTIEDRRIVEEIQHALGTKVHLLRSKKNRDSGKLILEFYNPEDLQELHKRLAN